MIKLKMLWRFFLGFGKRRSTKKIHQKLKQAEALMLQAESAIAHFVSQKMKHGPHLKPLVIKKLAERQFEEQLKKDNLKLMWNNGHPKVVYA